ncbi:MAG: MFS transporter [Candidatus Bipolaricaulis sp.]|nr:MFS transporter [Candidatus Bipolaricaulis sp.]
MDLGPRATETYDAELPRSRGILPDMQDTSRARFVLVVASLAIFLAGLTGSSLNIALPSIGREFGVGAVAIGWATTAYLLAVAVGLLPLGRLADLRGRSRAFTAGAVVFTAASLLCALAPSYRFLVGARALQGLGGAILVSTSTALVCSAFPPEERGRALGWNTAAVYLGMSVGPFLGGILTTRLGWRSVFVTTVPLGLLVAVLSAWRIRDESREPRGARFDVVGTVIYGAGIAGLMIGLAGLPARQSVALLLLGAATLIAFGIRELRHRSPLLDLRLFRTNPTLTLSNLAAFANYAATAAVGFLLSLYLQYNRGLTAEQAGLLLIAQPVVQALFSPLAGRMSDHVAPRIVASAGMAMTTLGLASFALLGPRTPIPVLVSTLAWLGLSFALFSAPNTNAVMGCVDRRSYGMASASLATMRALGQMTSMAVAMLLLSLYVGSSSINGGNATRFLGSARASFVVFAGMCFLGVFASLARGTGGIPPACPSSTSPDDARS